MTTLVRFTDLSMCARARACARAERAGVRRLTTRGWSCTHSKSAATRYAAAYARRCAWKRYALRVVE